MDKNRAVAPLLLAACAAVAAFRRLTDPDLPWHMAAGRELFEGRWPGIDSFSYTFAGARVPGEYLADALLFWLSPQLAGGLAIGALAFLLYKRAGAGAAAFALAAMGPLLIVRPALLGFACFAAVLAASDRRAVPLQALWANLHGFAVVGAAAAWLKRPWRWALAATAATTLCVFGPKIFWGPFMVGGHSAWNAEWAPSSLELFTLYNPALGLFSLAVLWPARRDPLVLALFAATIIRYRMAPLFVIAAAPYFRVPKVPEAAAASLALFFLFSRGEAPFGKGWDVSRLPVAAADWIASKKLQGRVYNELSFGGWLIWRLREKVFIDGRTAWLYPPEFLRTAIRADNDPAAFASLEKEWGFRWALTDARPGPMKGYSLSASPGWTMVYCDDVAAVYVRKEEALAKEGYKALRHLSPWRLMPESGADAKTLRADAALAARQAPGSRRSILWRAGAALAAGDAEELERAIKALEAAYPGDPELPALERALVIR